MATANEKLAAEQPATEHLEPGGSNTQRRPRFGDWLRGIYAGEANPQRDGMYVRTRRHHGTTCYELTDGEGNFWLYPATSTVPLSERGQHPALAELPSWFRRELREVREHCLNLVRASDRDCGDRAMVTLTEVADRIAALEKGEG